MLDHNEDAPLPCATTMRKVVFPRLLSKNFVKSTIKNFQTKPGYSTYISNSSSTSNKQTEAVVVLPSSWAKLDVQSLHVLRQIACIKNCRCDRRFGSADLRVDTSNHIRRRADIVKHSDTLWVNKDGIPVPSSPGTQIRLHTFDDNIHSIVLRTIQLCTEEVKYRGQLCTAFNAEIISTVHARYSSEKGTYFEHGLQPVNLVHSSHRKYEECLSFLKTLIRPHESDSTGTRLNAAETNAAESP